MKPTTSVLYHANCTDGFMAAFVIWHYSKQVDQNVIEYIPCQYGQPVPKINGEHVLVLDFSFDLEQLHDENFKGKEITILDHHETAANKYGGYGTYRGPCCNDHSSFTALFKQHLSGAGLARDYAVSDFILAGREIEDYHKYDRLNYLVNRVQDRDLWQFKLRNTREVYEILNGLERTFEAWEAVLCMSDADFFDQLKVMATRIQMREELAQGYADKATVVPYLEGTMAIVNCPSNFASEVGALLAQKHAFAMMFVLSPERRLFIGSLRSKAGGTDVSLIAAALGGGGHINAAGFSFDYVNEPTKLLSALDGSLFN